MALADVWQTRFVTQFGNQAGFNVRHWLVTQQTGADAQAQTVADQLDTIFSALYKPMMAVQASWIGVEAQRIIPTPAGVPVLVATRTGPGTVAGDALPPQVAGVISLKTQFAGRKYRGRLYTPFIGELSNDVNGIPVPGYVVQLGALATQLTVSHQITSGADSTVLTPIVFHRKDSTYTIITSNLVRKVWGTQRRRGLFGRPNPIV
jgi:hypothetical protein